MGLSRALKQRSGDECELCSSSSELNAYLVSPKTEDIVAHQIVACSFCLSEINSTEGLDQNHWRCLNDSMWSEVPAVQVMAYRILHRLKSTDWASDLIDMMYMDETTKEWADSGIEDETDRVIHKDSNGAILNAGDTVTLIKDLKVKGSSLIAKRGTAVRRIRLVHDNPNQIEGKVEGQTVIILTQFVKKM